MTSNAETTLSVTGEKLVENWLARKGYHNILKTTVEHGASAIEATGSIEDILVVVKTTISPDRPLEMNVRDKSALKLWAENLTRKAYVAYVVIDEEKKLVGEILWERVT